MRKLILNLLVLFLLVSPFSLDAASKGAILYLSPNSGIYSVGDVFKVQVLVDSGGEEINAGEAKLTFNPKELSVEKISTDGSIFNLWPVGPKFSNASGTIEFAGGSTKKFAGKDGLVLTITFKALRSIVSRANIASGAILAADGTASNIITAMESGVYTLKPKQIEAQVKHSESEGPPPLPVITSSTHPDPNSWYQATTAEFSWKVPEDVTAVRLLVDSNPDSTPEVLYEPPIDYKKIKNIDDGIWYFHVQMKNYLGWSKPAHFRFQIDTEKPEKFEIKEQKDTNIFDSKAEILFDGEDKLSGIDKYEIYIDDKEAVFWHDDGSHIYKTPSLEEGEHNLAAKALDKAGNFLWATTTFKVKSYGPPLLIKYPKTINISKREALNIYGKTIPNAKVAIWLQRNKEPAVKSIISSDSNGLFAYSKKDFKEDGIYYLWANAYDENGSESPPSEKISFRAELTGFDKLISLFQGVLVIFAPFALLIVLAGLLIGYGWYRYRIKQGIEKREN